MISKIPETKSNSQRFLKLAGSSMLTSFFMVACRLLRNILLAQLLGPTQRGALALAMSVAEIVMTLLSFGYNTSIGYYTSHKFYSNNKIFMAILNYSVAVGILMIISCLLIFMLPGFLTKGNEVIEPYIYLLAFTVPLLFLKSSLLVFNNGLNRINAFNSFRVLDSFLPLFFFILFVYVFKMATLKAAFFSWSLSVVVNVLINCASLIKVNIKPVWIGWREQQAMAKYGFTAYFDTVFKLLLLRIDHMIVGFALGATQLGYYAMATTATELLLIVSESVTVPLFSKLQAGISDKNSEDQLKIAIRVTNTIVLMAAIGLAITGELLIALLFGKDFLPAYYPMLFLIPGVIALNMCAIVRLVIIGKGKAIDVSKVSGLALLVNIICNILLIPLMGISGAALASSIAYLFAAYCFYKNLKQDMQVTITEILLIVPNDIKWIKYRLNNEKY